MNNCGGHIHAVFICNARLFCMGKGSSKEQRYGNEEEEAEVEIEDVSLV
jgi:hypothetical protein